MRAYRISAGMPVPVVTAWAVRGEHPEVAADQYGASAHRVGRPILMAAATMRSTMGWAFRYGGFPLFSER